MLKKVLKWAAILLGSLIAIALIAGWALNKKLPEAKEGPEAEALAEKMMKAVNCAAWDTIGAISWDFAGMNQHLWDKKRHYAQVEWGEGMRAIVDINKRTGKAYKNGEELSGEEAAMAVETAWKFWVNDSYWLNAPCKIMDGGTRRGIVEMENGTSGLLVSYDSGGATPGDKYLWELDENGKPLSYSMWVSILPIGGISFSWENWQSYEGSLIASTHEGAFSLQIVDIKTANTPAELNGGVDPFGEL